MNTDPVLGDRFFARRDILATIQKRLAAFQNGYFAALVNRVGQESELTFAGESFITSPDGKILASAPSEKEAILYADLDFGILEDTHATKYFLKDRRPGKYGIIS